MGWIDMHCDTLSGILMGERGSGERERTRSFSLVLSMPRITEMGRKSREKQENIRRKSSL